MKYQDTMRFQVVATAPDGNTVEILNPDLKHAAWTYARNGGCGAAIFSCARELHGSEFFNTAPLKTDFAVKVRNPANGTYSTRYSGFLTGHAKVTNKGRQTVGVKCYGYIKQLERFVITAEPTYGVTVAAIMKELLNTYITPNTTITYDAMYGVEGSFVIAGLKLTGMTVAEAIQLLAMIQGNTEYGVGADKKFYHKTESAVVGHVDIKSKDCDYIAQDRITDPLSNRIRLQGGITDAGVGYTRTYNDAGLQGTDGIRETEMYLPAVITDAVADRLAANYTTIMGNTIRMIGYERIVDWFDWIEQTVPIPLVRTHFKGITKDFTPYDLPVNEVQYIMDGKRKKMRMELGRLFYNQRGWQEFVNNAQPIPEPAPPTPGAPGPDTSSPNPPPSGGSKGGY